MRSAIREKECILRDVSRDEGDGNPVGGEIKRWAKRKVRESYKEEMFEFES